MIPPRQQASRFLPARFVHAALHDADLKGAGESSNLVGVFSTR